MLKPNSQQCLLACPFSTLLPQCLLGYPRHTCYSSYFYLQWVQITVRLCWYSLSDGLWKGSPFSDLHYILPVWTPSPVLESLQMSGWRTGKQRSQRPGKCSWFSHCNQSDDLNEWTRHIWWQNKCYSNESVFAEWDFQPWTQTEKWNWVVCFFAHPSQLIMLTGSVWGLAGGAEEIGRVVGIKRKRQQRLDKDRERCPAFEMQKLNQYSYQSLITWE